MLEDSKLDAELTLRHLRDMEYEFDIKIVETKADFEQAVKKWSPDLIISDYNLQTFKGDEALAFAKEMKPQTPFITLSGSITKKMQLTLLENRANDVLTKDNLKRLPFAISRVLNERKEKQKLDSILYTLQETNQKLNQILEEKEALVGEVHHRVKNNLALISSFLQLDQMGLESHLSSDVLLSANILRIKSISIVHETVYHHGSFSKILVKDILREILKESFNEKNSIQLVLKEEEKADSVVTFNINQAVPFSLLISEIFFTVLQIRGELALSSVTEIILSVDQKDDVILVSLKEKKLTKILSILKEGESQKFSEIIEVLGRQLKSELLVDEKNETTTIKFEAKNVKGASSALK